MVRPSKKIYAHRGSTVLAPENTSEAFDLALALGAHVLETDVRITRDDVVLVTHDATLERTTDGYGRVREQTAAALGHLDATSRFCSLDGGTWTGRRVGLMSLDELLERYADTEINIDIKDAEPAAARVVAATLQRHSALDRINVGSFHASVIRTFRRLCPSISTAATRGEVAQLFFGRYLGRTPQAPNFRMLQIPVRYGPFDLAGQGFAEFIDRTSLERIYWTINDPLQMQQLLDGGAAGIVTDRPDLAASLSIMKRHDESA